MSQAMLDGATYRALIFIPVSMVIVCFFRAGGHVAPRFSFSGEIFYVDDPQKEREDVGVHLLWE